MDAENPQLKPESESVEMPAPTFWPMALAFGLTLVFAGLVTHFAVSIIGGIIAVRAAVGWWRDVIPHELHEYVPVRPLSERAAAVITSERSVASLKAGAEHHRMRIPEKIHPYYSGLWGGLAGGTVMAALACLYGVVVQRSIWYPINLLAAALMPSLADAGVAGLKSFNATALIAALILHGGGSLLVGTLYAAILPMFPKRAPLWGGVLAPLIWSGLIASSLDLTNPALSARISWPWFIACQLGFGLVAGFVVSRTQKIDVMQNWTFAERASVDAPGLPREEGDNGK